MLRAIVTAAIRAYSNLNAAISSLASSLYSATTQTCCGVLLVAHFAQTLKCGEGFPHKKQISTLINGSFSAAHSRQSTAPSSPQPIQECGAITPKTVSNMFMLYKMCCKSGQSLLPLVLYKVIICSEYKNKSCFINLI